MPYFLCGRLSQRGMTAERLLVYCWIYAHNEKTGKGQAEAFGMTSYRKLWRKMSDDLSIADTGNLCRKLEALGWLKKTTFHWKGVKMVGYLCMLDKEARIAAKAGQQEMQMPDEESTVEVDSAVQRVNAVEREERSDLLDIWMIGGRYYYLDENGERHYVPQSAAVNPPPKGWVFDDERECWCRPEEVTQHEMDY